MTEEVRALALVKAGLEARQPLDMLLKEARVWGARQALFKSALKRLDGIRANAALAHAAGIDRLVKGSGTGDVWDEFLRLGLSIGA
jgi:DNA polymerase-3 subunit delta